MLEEKVVVGIKDEMVRESREGEENKHGCKDVSETWASKNS